MECQSAICQSDYSQKLITDLVIYPQGIVAGPNILTHFQPDILRLIVLQVLYYPTNPPDILTEGLGTDCEAAAIGRFIPSLGQSEASIFAMRE